MKSKYIHRVCERELVQKLKVSGAVQIIGPKWCGKTTTALQFAESAVEMQDPDNREKYLETAGIRPSNLLIGAVPRLIDEWQTAPDLWDAVRVSVDRRIEPGLYILTASYSVEKADIVHTGTGRIDTLAMYPMSLFESGESNGSVSLTKLFDGEGLPDGCVSDLTLDGLIFAACRGGWPSAVMNNQSDQEKLKIPRGYFEELCTDDISNADGKKRKEKSTRLLLRSYARNISTQAGNRSILKDINADTGMSNATYYSYLSALKKMFVIQDVEAWCPAIRTKGAIQLTDKKEFVDPSIVVAALGVDPAYFNLDLKTFGLVFETLCFRDLKVYSGALGGRVSYYRDRYGLEADCVLHLRDGRYALIEMKLGSGEIEAAAAHLLKIETLIRSHNETEKHSELRLPDLKIVITGSQYGYERPDGVFVVPIGCLRD